MYLICLIFDPDTVKGRPVSQPETREILSKRLAGKQKSSIIWTRQEKKRPSRLLEQPLLAKRIK
jgi:hypothetical protein